MKTIQTGAVWNDGTGLRGRMEINGEEMAVYLIPNGKKVGEKDPDFFIKVRRHSRRPRVEGVGTFRGSPNKQVV